MNSLTQLLPTDKAVIDEHFGGYFFEVPELSKEKMLYEFDKALKEKDWKSIHYLRKLFNDSSVVKDIEKIMEKHDIDLTCSKKWKNSKQSILKLTEGFLLYMLPLGFYLYGSEELQFSKDTQSEEDRTSWPKRGHFDMDDFVFDKHTKCAIDRSNEYFVKETSKVSNEVFIVPDEFKAIYEWSRCGKIVFEIKKDVSQLLNKTLDKTLNETDLDFVVRIQLTTSNQKQDTYYAEYNKELYFVKGPFKDRLVVDNYIKFQGLKKERGIPHVKDVYCLMLYPNRWTPEEIPLGYRKSIDPKKQYPFLIAKSVLCREQIKTRVHSSVKWPATTIVDDHETNGMRIDVFKLKDQMMIDYLNAIAFRLEYNIGDFADRNFLRIDSRVLSVDEEITKSKKVNLKSELKVKKYNYVMKSFETYKEVEKGDLIFCLYDIEETPRTVGLSNHDGMITGSYKIFKTIDVLPKFTFYTFLIIDDVKGLKPYYTGMRNVVRPETFKSLPFHTPPLSEQEEIVSYLDEQTQLIDKTISVEERRIDTLKEYRQSLISEVVTGKRKVTNDE
jgi:hypothetical protein